MRVEPVNLLGFSSPYIPKIEKSPGVLAKERIIKEQRKIDARLLEKEDNIRLWFPSWLGKNLNILV